MNLVDQAKHALWKKSGLPHDAKGYVEDVGSNLISGVTEEMIESDYRSGSGKEWQKKIRAIHSSAALAANTFGRWKNDPEILKILRQSGFESPRLEAQCPTGLKGTPPNLDVLLKSQNVVIGVESKFLEPLKLTKPEFSKSYLSKEIAPLWEKPWKTLFDQVRQWQPSHLDIAQLIKHYLGLRKRQEYQYGRQVFLLYIYWKPRNADIFPEYSEHEKAIQKVQAIVADGSKVQFVAMDYLELWQAWAKDTDMAEHARSLQARYCVEI